MPATPGTVVVVVNSVIGHSIQLWMFRRKLSVEPIDRRMGLNAEKVALAKAPIKRARLLSVEALMREPNSEIATHGQLFTRKRLEYPPPPL